MVMSAGNQTCCAILLVVAVTTGKVVGGAAKYISPKFVGSR